MSHQGGQAIAIDRPRACWHLPTADDRSLCVPCVAKRATRWPGDDVYVLQYRHDPLTHPGQGLLSVQIVCEGLIAPACDGTVVLGPGVDLLWGEMVVNINRRLGSQCR